MDNRRGGVLLSVYEGEEDIWRAVQAGALGCVPKSAEIADVLEAIRELAAALHLSEAAVKLHISNTLTKLGVADRTQAAIQAVRRGIVHLDA